MRKANNLAILLDTGPLGLVTAPVGHTDGDSCKQWYATLEAIGSRFYVPQIADYELRRELIRSHKTESVAMLNTFNKAEADRYLCLTADQIHLAAQFWARLRNEHRAGTDDKSLDADLLIAAQAEELLNSDPFLDDVIVATTNPKHLKSVTRAELWSDIHP